MDYTAEQVKAAEAAHAVGFITHRIASGRTPDQAAADCKFAREKIAKYAAKVAAQVPKIQETVRAMVAQKA